MKTLVCGITLICVFYNFLLGVSYLYMFPHSCKFVSDRDDNISENIVMSSDYPGQFSSPFSQKEGPESLLAHVDKSIDKCMKFQTNLRSNICLNDGLIICYYNVMYFCYYF